MKNKTKVWDFPTRLFHWLLAASLPFMWYSAKTGGDMLQWHTRVGLFILFLLVFRLCWGIWGSDTARFSRFVRGWSGIREYMKNGIPEHVQPGHNPLGALMVVALFGRRLISSRHRAFCRR
ncbi:cytochrome b561 family protein [Neisseria meningitidis 992008]|nr:cytochrome b561 family protein [Neisseria meningitidis 992008]